MDIKLAEQRLAREFGSSLRHRRKTLGYTQEDLASMIGTNRRFISELERGKGTSYLGPALAAAEALGINISILFEDHHGAPSALPERNRWPQVGRHGGGAQKPSQIGVTLWPTGRVNA